MKKGTGSSQLSPFPEAIREAYKACLASAKPSLPQASTMPQAVWATDGTGMYAEGHRLWGSLKSRGWGRPRASCCFRGFPGLAFQNSLTTGSWWGNRGTANKGVQKPGSVAISVPCSQSHSSQDQDAKDGQSKHRALLESRFPSCSHSEPVSVV